MKMIVDATVLMKDIEIDLDYNDIKRISKDYLSKEKSHMVLHEVMDAWKRRRGVLPAWIVKDGSKKWQEYENNGSHYSGYFDRNQDVTELDRVIYDCYRNLEVALCKFESELNKEEK